MEEQLYFSFNGFTDAELSVILQGLNKFIYDNPHLTEEQYDIANSAIEKICDMRN